MKQKASLKTGKLNFSYVNKVWRLLPVGRKKESLWLLFFMAVGMILEMLSLGTLLPVIAFVAQPELMDDFPFINKYLGGVTQLKLLVIAVSLIFIIYFLKNVYLSFLAWKQSRFVYGTQGDMANSLLSSYLWKPYDFHLQRNSSELTNNLQVELNLFIVYMLSPGISLIAESMVVVGMFILLIFIEPIGSISVCAFFLISAGIYQYITNLRSSGWGAQRQYHERLRMKSVKEALGSIKHVKTFQVENHFLHTYKRHTNLSLHMLQRNWFLKSITRFWLEVLAIAALFILLLGMIFQGKAINQIFPVIGLFAAVAFRLMPSANRMLSALQQIRFGVAITDDLENEYSDKARPSENSEIPSELPFNNQIKLQNVSFRYPSSETFALNSFSLSIQKGQMIGIVGESGSGKSTIVDVILGLLKPQAGEILVDGTDIHSNLIAWKKLVGYVTQDVFLLDDSVLNNIAFGISSDAINMEAVGQACQLAQLETLIQSLPSGLDTRVGENGETLSGGQKQRVAIARALYHDPEIIIMDEATSALDMGTEKELMSAINGIKHKKTIILIAHRLTTLSDCDVIFEISKGAVVNKTSYKEMMEKHN